MKCGREQVCASFFYCAFIIFHSPIDSLGWVFHLAKVPISVLFISTNILVVYKGMAEITNGLYLSFSQEFPYKPLSKKVASSQTVIQNRIMDTSFQDKCPYLSLQLLLFMLNDSTIIVHNTFLYKYDINTRISLFLVCPMMQYGLHCHGATFSEIVIYGCLT